MRYALAIVLLSLLAGLAAPVLAEDAQDAVPARSMKISRWVSNLSGGAVLGRQVGLVKSFWWYALAKVFAVGLSFDFVAPFIPLSINAAVQAPIPLVTPFVCGGVGGSITGYGITNYGGGFRVRLGPKFGLVVEYRRYHYTQDAAYLPGDKEKVAADYVGAGISWRY
jgi:hypothetical protein